ncbi:insulinase family protein [Lentisphaera profundi]|uniref:Insulinase family protein n=1 Tax=Lentisphaera profundi TaxID=1658616 RepID=A0ABY7VSI0_9BACT|nr:M16 family metallopeptidase [Lentisphaera profundi]WDE96175.1 insulinase family protein [Lentisphaera profundi]
MRIILLVSIFISFIAGAAEKLPQDKSLQLGELKNGMKYILRSNEKPPGKVSIYLHVGSGSLDEEENQLGLAHFLEHMAFNGSENFAPGELIKYFESIGLTFGMHQNAFTSFDQTTYSLDLPAADESTMDKGLLCMSDFAYRLLLVESEIDRERGVIQEEEVARDSLGYRMLKESLPQILPNSRIAKRLPIGDMEIIKTAPRQRFVDFYKKWYKPDNTTLIIVGNADMKMVEKLVEKHFSGWKGQVEKHAKPEVKAYTEDRIVILTDPELTTSELTLYGIEPEVEVLETEMDYFRSLQDSVISWMMNQRLAKLKQTGEAAFLSASIGRGDLWNAATMSHVGIEAKNDRWEEAVKQVMTELKRLEQHGFDKTELIKAKKAQVSSLDKAIQAYGNLSNGQIIKAINNDVTQGVLSMSPMQEKIFLEKYLDKLNLVQLHQIFDKNHGQGHRLAMVQMPSTVDVPTKEKVRKLLDDLAEIKIEAGEFAAIKDQLLETAPVAKEIIKETVEKDLGISEFHFENGVVCRHRHMPYEKDQVYVELNIAGGVIEEKENQLGLTRMAATVLNQASSSLMSFSDIRDWRIGKKFNLMAKVESTRVHFSLSSTKKDLPYALEMLHMYLTDYKIDDKLFEQAREQALVSFKQLPRNSNAMLSKGLYDSVWSHEKRLDPFFKEDFLNSVQRSVVEAWIQKVLYHNPIEMSIVGDIDLAESKNLIAKFQGSIDKRRELKEISFDIAQPIGDVSVKTAVETKDQKCLILSGWNIVDVNDKDGLALFLAGKIASTRLFKEIREKRNLTYSIFSTYAPSRPLRQSSKFYIYFTAQVDKAEQAATEARAVLTQLRDEGVDPDELDKVRKQIKNILEEELVKPSFWAGKLGSLDIEKDSVTRFKTLQADYAAVTAEQIQALLKRCFIEENSFQVITIPQTEK